MKQYISLRNRVILTKTKRSSFISPTISNEKTNLNLQGNFIIDLATYLGLSLIHLLDAKDDLYVAKNVVSLHITQNRSVMTQRSVLTSSFYSAISFLVMRVICKST